MKKIPSLFKRNYDGDRLVYDEVVEGCEWVIAGEGIATVKLDGTACMIAAGVLYKRYDRKVSKGAKKRGAPFIAADYKAAPDGWIAAEDSPNEHTGHWPGWLPVGDGPADQYHREAFDNLRSILGDRLTDETCELIGPKIQGNPYRLKQHRLIRHGGFIGGYHGKLYAEPPRDFDGLRDFLADNEIEGIVWHHPDGRMCKIKRRDFGFSWPPK
jgi:hypothetical protein